SIVEKALENAKYTEGDEIAIMRNYPDVDIRLDVYSKELDKIGVEEKIQFAKDMEKFAKAADKRVFNIPNSVVRNGTGYTKIANSKGLNKEEKQNFAFAYVGALSQEKDDKRMGVDFIIGRDFSKFKAKKLAEKSVEKSTSLLGGEAIKSGPYQVVLNNEMMATMLSTFSGIFSAKAVQEGRSLLKDKLGKNIANNKVTIIDDALHPDGFATRYFDSEGYPSQTTALIKNGKLKSYLHNTQTARKDKVKSTGNGSRSYKGSLVISPSNFYLEQGNIKEEELFEKHAQTIEIVALQGMHSGANPISGDFSLSAEGFLYQDGKRKHSLKQFTVSGNILQVLQDVEMIADNFKFDMSSIGAASVLVKDLAISG
ncbi:MAG: TldD/PmbA family protein, partial [Candidatus Cloacimonetes bacterium]|nr:TldD/PmbA family protein [Candidatus Cloacimonadota bacterium]